MDFWEWDQATDTWTQIADFGGTGRFGATAFSIGSKGYVTCGSGVAGPTKDLWEYDPITNNWIQKANLPGAPRYVAAGFTIDMKGYVMGGDGSPLDIWEYNPLTNAWIIKLNFTGSARTSTIGLSIGSKGYIGLGHDGFTYYYDFWEWDPGTNIWTQKADLPAIGRNEASAFHIGDYGYVGLGTTNTGTGTVSSFWRYEPISNTWTTVPNFGAGKREMAVSFSIGCKGYIATGIINDIFSACKKDLWEFSDIASCCNATFSITGDSIINEGEYTTLTALDSTSGINYLWSTGDTTPSITVSPAVTSIYCLMIENENGCSDSLCYTVTVNQNQVDIPFFMPSVLVGNQSFVISGLQPGSTLEAFDIRGRLVFRSVDYKNDLTGYQLASGIYLVYFEKGGNEIQGKLFVVR